MNSIENLRFNQEACFIKSSFQSPPTHPPYDSHTMTTLQRMLGVDPRPVAYLGGACGHAPSPPRKVRKRFLTRKKTYIFCSKVPSKCRKCHFRDANFKMGFQTYIFCSKVPSKCRKCRFKDPNFNCVVIMASPLTKILATPLPPTHQSRGKLLPKNKQWTKIELLEYEPNCNI